jgi:hypothetical protein
MSGIRTGRWLAGGIAAGIVVNVSEMVLNMTVLRNAWADVLSAMGKPMAASANAMIVWVLWGFAYGLICIWLYAAIRPRFGPGPATAVKAGVVAWLLAQFLSSVAMGNLGIVPASLLVISGIWTLAESVVASLVGAWVYREAAEA